ncbi:hypothetical protein [Leptonema illini]|uniref:Lipoprotein n=1 Tax=Leptonema illini DSM 21528 TaxID=929563 RepID=H2CA35_9LEPT|nr:hypothetical protein [Leptonema illini]EHQ05159.1 hypothetical protein Lepil_0455 [Leptonema illini DSM 21528]
MKAIRLLNIPVLPLILLAACSVDARPLQFEVVPRLQGTAVQAGGDGDLVGTQIYRFSLKRAIDVTLSAEIVAQRTGISASFVREGLLFSPAIPCQSAGLIIRCHAAAGQTLIGTYRITLNSNDGKPITYRLFVALQGPGYAEVEAP